MPELPTLTDELPKLTDDLPELEDDRTALEEVGRKAALGVEGFNIGLRETVKAPTSLLQYITGGAAQALDLPAAMLGAETLPSEAHEQFFEKELQGVDKGFEKAGFTSEELTPETPTERIVQTAGTELGFLVAPLGAQFQAARSVKPVLSEADNLLARTLAETAMNPNRMAAVEAGLALAAGTGVGAAEELFPDSPTAKIIGGMLGMLGAAGASRAVSKLKAGVSPETIARETVPQNVPASEVNIRFTQQEPVTAKATDVSFGEVEPLKPNFPKAIQAGPFSAPVTPIGKPGSSVFREMGPDGLSDILMANNSGGPASGFFANEMEFALGQGANKGIRVKLKADFVSGERHMGKPGLAVPGIGVKEYRANFIAKNAVEFIEVDPGVKLPPLARRLLKNSNLEMSRKDDGTFVFTPAAGGALTPPQQSGALRPSTTDVSIPSGVDGLSDDFAGNINLRNFRTTEEAKQLMRANAQANDEFIAARRGTMTLEEIETTARQNIADDIDIPVEKVGQAFNAEELTGLRIMLAESSEDVTNLSRRINAGNDSTEVLAQYQAALLRNTALQEQVSGATAEAGRALSAARITAKTEKQRTEALRQLIDTHGGDDSLRDLAAKITSINDPAALQRFIRQSQKATFSDKALEVYINSLLSGPQTHAVNITSNALFGAYQIPERLLAGVVSKATKGEISLLEAPAQAIGMVQGIDRKSTRLNSSHYSPSRMPSSA